jgi:hypothetical protein
MSGKRGRASSEPYKHYLAERVKAAAPEWIPATVLLRELRALGYQGGISILKDHLATLRPVAKPEPLIRFETEPGRQLQPLPTPWPGAIQNTCVKRQAPIPRGYQHSLQVYEELISAEVR